jgi:phosphate-selective porin
MRRSVFAFLVLLAGAGAASVASAQETGTPVFKAPYRAFQSHEFGANLSFPSGAADFGLEGFYTYGYNRFDIGLRGGIVSIDQPVGGNDTRIALGGSFRARVVEATQTFPLDGALTVGVGTQFGEGTDFVLIPVGISLGRRLQLEGSRTSFVPYVHPVIVPTVGGGDSEVNFALGLGADIRFSDSIDLRVSAGIGDIEGVGLGIAFVR